MTRRIAIYPGRFHIFHVGHKFVYDYLVGQYGADNVYITSTGIVELPKSPFSFEEKKAMMVLTGVPEDKIIKVKRNYNDTDILENISGIIPNETNLFYAVSSKDMQDDPRFNKFIKKDGTPSYLQPKPQNESAIETMDKHAYIITVPSKSFPILGKVVSSASAIRDMFSKLMPAEYKSFMVDLFGAYDAKVLNILKGKLQSLTESRNRIMKKSQLKEIIKQCIRELSVIKEQDAPTVSPNANAIKAANIAAANKMVESKKLALKDAEDALKTAKDAFLAIKQDKNAKPEDIDKAKETEDNATERVNGSKASLESVKKKVQAAQQGSSVD